MTDRAAYILDTQPCEAGLALASVYIRPQRCSDLEVVVSCAHHQNHLCIAKKREVAGTIMSDQESSPVFQACVEIDENSIYNSVRPVLQRIRPEWYEPLDSREAEVDAIHMKVRLIY